MTDTQPNDSPEDAEQRVEAVPAAIHDTTSDAVASTSETLDETDQTQVETADAQAAIDAYGVNLEVFEGPLDLLLYLIRKNEVDIYDIPVARITAQYLAFLRAVHLLDLESAADFILMAATLMKIKSQMLLPREIEGDELDEGIGDPREELVRKLLEYQQFKEIADWLGDQGTEQRDIFQRPGGLPEDGEDAELQPVSLFDLLKVYKHVIDHVPQAAVHRIIEEEVAIEECIERIIGELEHRSRLRFHDLVSGQSKVAMVATFIGILELLKSQRIRVHQSEPFKDIWIEDRSQDATADAVDDSAAHPPAETDAATDVTTVGTIDEPAVAASPADLSDAPTEHPPSERGHIPDGPRPMTGPDSDSPESPSLHVPARPPTAADDGADMDGGTTASDTDDDTPAGPTALALQEPDDLETDAARVVDAAERLGEQIDQVPPPESVTGTTQVWEDEPALSAAEDDSKTASAPTPPPPASDMTDPEERT